MGIVTHDVELLTEVKPKEVADLIDEYSYIWKNKVKHWRDLF